MKTILVVEFNIPAREAFDALPSLLADMARGPAPMDFGEVVAGPVEFCCLNFGTFVCKMEP